MASGKKYVSPSLAEELANAIGDDCERPPHEKLSDREYQTLCMIASGKTPAEIAEALNLSVKTVSVYRARLLEKMNLRNNAELTTTGSSTVWPNRRPEEIDRAEPSRPAAARRYSERFQRKIQGPFARPAAGCPNASKTSPDPATPKNDRYDPAIGHSLAKPCANSPCGVSPPPPTTTAPSTTRSPARHQTRYSPSGPLRQLAAALPRHNREALRIAQDVESAIGTGDWAALRAALVTALSNTDSPELNLGGLLRDLITEWDRRHAGLTQARKREMLERVLSASGTHADKLVERLNGMLRSWIP